MLNDSLVLDYVKRNLGFPFMHLEWKDEEILEYIKKFTIREFSYYVPNVQTLPINFQNIANKVPGKSNEYYLFEPEGREILGIKNIYFDQSDYFAMGHPPMGVFSYGQLGEMALQTHLAMSTKLYSVFDKTFEFKHPNIVRVSPVPVNSKFATVEYERIQCDDFREIPNDIGEIFLDLSLADIMIALGRIRKRYGGGNLRTPFGEIPLESDIFEEGKEKKREIKDLLERTFIPNITIAHG
jgi:hypothetical protein